MITQIENYIALFKKEKLINLPRLGGGFVYGLLTIFISGSEIIEYGAKILTVLDGFVKNYIMFYIKLQ